LVPIVYGAVADAPSFSHEGAETLLLDDHAVGSHGQVGCQVTPKFVGGEIEFTVRLDIDYLNPGARDSGPIGILHRSPDAAAVGLRKYSKRRRNQRQYASYYAHVCLPGNQ